MQAQATRLIHAYKQAPWRIQRQYVGAFLLVVIGLAMIAALYLLVTARAAATGREIQELRLEIINTQQVNADLETQLAKLTSSGVMEQRAIQLGYRPIKPGDINYVTVPGYVAPEPEILRKAVDVSPFPQALPDAYTLSLMDWFDQRITAGGH